MKAGSQHMSVQRIEAALLKVAALMECDPAFTPIFERLEAELQAARQVSLGKTEAQSRAAQFIQSAKARSNSATWPSDAPLP